MAILRYTWIVPLQLITQVFHENMVGYFDEEAMALVNRGINPISFPGLITTITSEESKAINFDDIRKLSYPSGMCDAGGFAII